MSSIAATPLPPAEVRRESGPLRLCAAVLAFATVTVLKGAMTTSTGSGLAYPDYPLSDGELMPVSSYTTVPGFLEHFHRLAAATTGLLALALAIWLTAGRRADARARATAWGGGILLLIQALFGGIGVLLQLPVFTSVVHATLAQLTLATFAWLAYQLTDRYRTTAPLLAVPAGTGRRLALVALALVVVQTVIGALARHANSPQALWTHVGNAFVVFVVVTIATAFALGRLGAAPGIAGLARGIVGILIAQIALGFVVLAVRNPAGKTPANVERLGLAAVVSAHVVLGALLTVLLAMLAAHVHRVTRREPAAAAPRGALR